MAMKESIQMSVDDAIQCVERAQGAVITVVKQQFDELCSSGFAPHPVKRFTHLLNGVSALQLCATALYRV